MKSINETQKLRKAIWAANKTLEEAENIKQEYLEGCGKKIVMLHVDDLRTLMESAQCELESTLKEVKEGKKCNPTLNMYFWSGA